MPLTRPSPPGFPPSAPAMESPNPSMALPRAYGLGRPRKRRGGPTHGRGGHAKIRQGLYQNRTSKGRKPNMLPHRSDGQCAE